MYGFIHHMDIGNYIACYMNEAMIKTSYRTSDWHERSATQLNRDLLIEKRSSDEIQKVLQSSMKFKKSLFIALHSI